MKAAAFGTLLYSLTTRYEWGLGPVKILPMPAHLACDGGSGALFRAAPWLLPGESPAVKKVLVGIGLFELWVTLNSQAQTGTGEN